MCESELTEFFAELTEFAPKTQWVLSSETVLSKQYSARFLLSLRFKSLAFVGGFISLKNTEISPYGPCILCAAIRILRLASIRVTFVPHGIAEWLARVDRVHCSMLAIGNLAHLSSGDLLHICTFWDRKKAWRKRTKPWPQWYAHNLVKASQWAFQSGCFPPWLACAKAAHYAADRDANQHRGLNGPFHRICLNEPFSLLQNPLRNSPLRKGEAFLLTVRAFLLTVKLLGLQSLKAPIRRTFPL